MKRLSRLTRCIIPVLILFASAATGHTQQREPQPIEVHERDPGIYEVTGGSGANTGFYIGDSEVVIIDTKMDEQSNRDILAHITRLTDKPVTYVINTHSDGDHVNGNPYYPTDAVIISHDGCRAEMLLPGRDGGPSMWTDAEHAPFVPALTFRDRMVLHLGPETIELWHFGTGHTTGDAVVYFPSAQFAFIGDQYFEGRPQLIHAYKGGSSFGHVKNLTAMLDTIDAERFISGHGEPATRAQIRDHIAVMQARQEKVRGLMAQNMSLDDIKDAFDESEGALVEVIYNALGE